MSPSTLASVASILRLSGRIGTVADLPEMLKATADTVAALLPADRVAIIEFDLEAHRLEQFVGGGAGAGSILTDIEFDELWEGLSGWVLREHQPALSLKERRDSRESAPVQRRRLETNAGSIIVVPVLFQDRLLGTMTAINTPEQDNFTNDDVETMELFADICAVTMENTRLMLQLRRSQRELVDENDLKDRLFAVLAHDLRGPIGTLRSMLTLIAERVDEADLVRELIGLGVDSVGRTFRLTENLLTWIRGQIKGTLPATQRVVARDLLGAVKETLDSEAALKGIAIILETSDSLTFESEPNTVQTIVRNLISNALEFSPSGAEVHVSAERSGDEVIVEVRDTGTGMADEQLAGLFRGRPVHPVPGTNGEAGNGLGLMFSGDLAKTVHGWLEASSQLGVGSTFRLVLTDADADPEEL